MELKVHDQEIILQKLWKSRKIFDQELFTTTGRKLEVIFEGTENLDTGPDLKDAIIKLDGKLIKGDVEVHLNESGWYSHGHHTDPRYNNVVLHLISEKPNGKNLIEREDGVQIHQLFINIDSLKTALWKNPKTNSPEIIESSHTNPDCPLSYKEQSKILATINEAGSRRLHNKVEQLRENSNSRSWDQILYQKLLEALGYSKNQVPFRKLGELIPYELVCGEMQWVSEEMALKKCAALLFGASGLLPSQDKTKRELFDAETLDYIAPLEYLWDQMSHRLEIKPMKSQAWQFFRLRPQNFPTRRLAGMVQIIFRFYRQGLLDGLLKIFHGNTKGYDKITNELESALIAKADGFWSSHYRFDESVPKDKQKKDIALIGKDRARDIVVNIVFPTLYLHSTESRDGMLKNSVKEIYARYPKLAENSVTRAMKVQLFKKQTQEFKVVKSACQQQGLLYLNKLYCKTLQCSECLHLTP